MSGGGGDGGCYLRKKCSEQGDAYKCHVGLCQDISQVAVETVVIIIHTNVSEYKQTLKYQENVQTHTLKKEQTGHLLWCVANTSKCDKQCQKIKAVSLQYGIRGIRHVRGNRASNILMDY